MTLGIVRPFVFAALGATTAAQPTPTSTTQTATPNMAGIWVLNPALTERPQEIGFNRDWAPAGGPGGEGGSRSGGGRGRRGGSGAGGGASSPQMSRESMDDSTRVDQLTNEARTPPDRITIVQKETSVSVADDQGRSRTFHPNGQLEDLTIGTAALPTTARWDSGSLIVLFDVETGRQLRYTFTPAASPKRLLVDIRFIERGHEGDEVKLTYESPDEHDRAVLSGSPIPPAPPSAPGGAAPVIPDTLSPGASPARGPVLPPGSELRGLTTIATEVEELSAAASACGLDQPKIKASIERVLADAGLKAPTYGKEDAYVLVSVSTSKLPDGACVSRYDASLVSHADATFPYLKGTVAAVEVQLLHEGGMAGGSPAAHASAVMDALTKSVTKFVAQIKSAGK
jgi:hypothetical protein